jgi:hypothetical protein
MIKLYTQLFFHQGLDGGEDTGVIRVQVDGCARVFDDERGVRCVCCDLTGLQD